MRMNRFTSHNPRRPQPRQLLLVVLNVLALLLTTIQVPALLGVAQARMVTAGTTLTSTGRSAVPRPSAEGIDPQPVIDPVGEPSPVPVEETKTPVKGIETPKPTEPVKGTLVPKPTQPPKPTMLPAATQTRGVPPPTLTSTGILAPTSSIIDFTQCANDARPSASLALSDARS